MNTYGERIHTMAVDALKQYNRDVLAGGRPRYPVWIHPILVSQRPALELIPGTDAASSSPLQQERGRSGAAATGMTS